MTGFEFLPVCSDESLTGTDSAVSSTDDLGFPVTTELWPTPRPSRPSPDSAGYTDVEVHRTNGVSHGHVHAGDWKHSACVLQTALKLNLECSMERVRSLGAELHAPCMPSNILDLPIGQAVRSRCILG